ncbi:MAG: tRNA (guanosine(46)-N7)-methyltransferase TrmB, partial [Bacteroidota bacterium]|nr:tRNA (guanosine(46)-N7)-methyltransferase TrmB [Bacteroidota bacterium]
MAKHKLQLYSESLEFDTIIQPTLKEQQGDFEYQGNWSKNIFNNNNPIVVELGCGKAEYSLMLAQQHPEKNFIGVDIKGDRMLRGAREAKEKNITNIRFLRMQIEQIKNVFAKDEISEIWITFPDPFPIKPKKRL